MTKKKNNKQSTISFDNETVTKEEAEKSCLRTRINIHYPGMKIVFLKRMKQRSRWQINIKENEKEKQKDREQT